MSSWNWSRTHVVLSVWIVLVVTGRAACGEDHDRQGGISAWLSDENVNSLAFTHLEDSAPADPPVVGTESLTVAPCECSSCQMGMPRFSCGWAHRPRGPRYRPGCVRRPVQVSFPIRPGDRDTSRLPTICTATVKRNGRRLATRPSL